MRAEPPPLTVAAIEDRVRLGIEPPLLHGETTRRAAVAVVLREAPGPAGSAGGGGAEVLLIRRSERKGDPWSGHVAFPGGRADPGDPSIEATAVREAREEVGLDLAAPDVRPIGRLPDFPARAERRFIGLAITPVLFEVRGDPPLRLDAAEVAEARWVPLAALRSGAHDSRLVWWWRPVKRVPIPVPIVLRCWRYQGLTIWGLTYRMLRSLLEMG